MTGRSAVGPTMTSRVIENRLHVSSKYAEQMDRIATLGVATDYDQIGLKPDQREIESPPITHQIAVVEEQTMSGSPSSLSRIPARGKTRPRTPNLESDYRPEKLVDIPEPELLSSKAPPALGHRSDQGSDLNPPTHPDTSDLSHIRQQS